jgi:hypothetical protein
MNLLEITRYKMQVAKYYSHKHHKTPQSGVVVLAIYYEKYHTTPQNPIGLWCCGIRNGVKLRCTRNFLQVVKNYKRGASDAGKTQWKTAQRGATSTRKIDQPRGGTGEAILRREDALPHHRREDGNQLRLCEEHLHLPPPLNGLTVYVAPRASANLLA